METLEIVAYAFLGQNDETHYQDPLKHEFTTPGVYVAEDLAVAMQYATPTRRNQTLTVEIWHLLRLQVLWTTGAVGSAASFCAMCPGVAAKTHRRHGRLF